MADIDGSRQSSGRKRQRESGESKQSFHVYPLKFPRTFALSAGGRLTANRQSSVLDRRLQFLSERDSAFFQLVADHISLISEINPRRESTAESRFQFVASTANTNKRCTATLVRRRRSISAKVFSEIDSRFVDVKQRLGRSALGVNHVMAFELDM